MWQDSARAGDLSSYISRYISAANSAVTEPYNCSRMNQILSYLYLGGKSDAKDKEKLIKMKVKYILNCTPTRSQDTEAGCPNFYEKEKSFVYRRIPIFDNKGEDLLAHMTTAFNFIEEGKHYGNVLVHCHKGVSRSASFVIGYLMRKNEFTLEEALAHVQSCRPIVQPNTAFLEQLATYQPNEPQTSSGAETSAQVGPRASSQAVDIGPSMGPSVGPSIGPSVPEVAIVDLDTVQGALGQPVCGDTKTDNSLERCKSAEDEAVEVVAKRARIS